MSGLDVAAGAVGIASFGIEVCKSLLWYLESWKTYHTDVASAYSAIEDLSTTLTLLEGTLKQGQLDADRATLVRTQLRKCQDGLKDLESKLKELKKCDSPEGLREKMKQKAQRVAYPFRADALVRVRDRVSGLQDRLSLALEVLHFNTTANVAVALERMTLQQEADRRASMARWLFAPNFRTNHETQRQLHEPRTGDWLLRCNQYQSWKTGASNLLWISGKAGCGKSVLCYTMIEDVRLRCLTTPGTGLAFFYFTFSDDRKRQYQDLLLSLVSQLGAKEPGLSILSQAYDRAYSDQTIPSVDDLEKILQSMLDQYERVFLLLDALDESPKHDDVRRNLLRQLSTLVHSTTKIKILATSRDEVDIRTAMRQLNAEHITIDERAVDDDIQLFVANQISKDDRLQRIPSKTMIQVEDFISQNANGMFRWAYLVLREVQELEALKPKYVSEALRSLPTSLDATYERILKAIKPQYRIEALSLLKWLAYARSPPTLSELAEASIVDPRIEPSVDTENRGALTDTLNILSGLIVTVVEDHPSEYPRRDQADTLVRLAHFSVKEYLESRRIQRSSVAEFYMEPGEGHYFIAQSCLKYLLFYSNSEDKKSGHQDLVKFPLLLYAADTWFYHSALQQPMDIKFEEALITTAKPLRDWALVHREDDGEAPFVEKNIRSPLVYASRLGLEALAAAMLRQLPPGDDRKRLTSEALIAASEQGHGNIVKLLIDKGTDVDSIMGEDSEFSQPFVTALQAAVYRNQTEIVNLLLDRGADPNLVAPLYCEWAGRTDTYSTPLEQATANGRTEMMKLLLSRGADVNLLTKSENGSALQCAIFHLDALRLLLDRGAKVDLVSGIDGSALQRASKFGESDIVDVLLDKGADINMVTDTPHGAALHAASSAGKPEVVELLLARGADPNLIAGEFGTALRAAAFAPDRGSVKVMKLLLEKGADVNDLLTPYGKTNGFCILARTGHLERVDFCLDAGIQPDPYGPDSHRHSALHEAASIGSKDIVELLLDRGADIDLVTGPPGPEYRSALQVAIERRRGRVIELLRKRGAKEPPLPWVEELQARREEEQRAKEAVLNASWDEDAGQESEETSWLAPPRWMEPPTTSTTQYL